MRSPYSPIQFLTRLSHEELKAAHQVLGRIIFFLLSLHAAFYFNAFVQLGFLAKRIKDKDVIFGIISILLFAAISTTALGQLRRWNYRLFYISHVTIANLILVPLFIHVKHIRVFLYQIVLINAFHLFLRARSLKSYSGTIKVLPGTNLVQVHIPLTIDSMTRGHGGSLLTWHPGQHVYLSKPSGKAHSVTSYDQWLHTNPFTVASIPGKDKELLLVARIMDGNTKYLAAIARYFASTSENPKVPLSLEGPYGASTRMPDFSEFDRILFVAGGVGATFIVPIYRSIIGSREFAEGGGPQIRFVWVVRKLAETQWAFPASHERSNEPEAHSSDANAVEVYVTRPLGPNLQAGQDAGDDIELAEDEQLLSTEEQFERPRKGTVLRTGRPEIPTIVEEVLSKGGRMAVITCGPKALTEQLSNSVEHWVREGSDVYWHNETFGW
jgi:hypothetical protein